MERRLKERLTGAAVLVLLAVIFIPMLLNDTTDYNSEITGTNIPSRPEGEFSSRIVPLNQAQPEPEQKQEKPENSGAGGNEEGESSAAAAPASSVDVTEPEPVEKTVAGGLEQAAAVAPDKDMGVRAWIVQLGSFSSEKNAQSLNEKLRKQGFTAFVEPLKKKTKTIYRVRVGPELLRSDAEEIRDKIKHAIQMEGIVAPYP